MLDSLENAKRKQAEEQEKLKLEARSTKVRVALINLIRGKVNLELINNGGIFTGFTHILKVPEYRDYVVRLLVGIRHTTWLNNASQNDPTDKTLTSIDDNREVSIRYEVFDVNDAGLTTPISMEGYTLMPYHVIHPIDNIDGRYAVNLKKDEHEYFSRLAKFEEVMDLLKKPKAKNKKGSPSKLKSGARASTKKK